MDEPWRHYAKWNKPVTIGQIQYDSTYMRYLKQLKQQLELDMEQQTGSK